VSGRGSPFLSIVLPCFNEEAYLEGAVSAISSRLVAAGFPHEILIIDDGSTDGTAEKARALTRRFANAGFPGAASWCEVRVISYARNRGKGFAVRTGVRETRGRFVAFMDVDLSTSPSYIAAFLTEAAAGRDVVVASRRLSASRTSPPQGALRRVGGRVFTKLAVLALSLPPGTTDVTCGFKMFRGDAGRALFARARLDGWGFDAEILFLARRAGLSIHELPVHWSNRADSRVRVFRDALLAIGELISVRRHEAAGRYGASELPSAAPEASTSLPRGVAPTPDPAAGEERAQAGAGVGESVSRDFLGRS